mgnify:FL=1
MEALVEELKKEGIARDFVNRIQNLRKEMGMEVLDKIQLEVQSDTDIVNASLKEFSNYIKTETQAINLDLKPSLEESVTVEMDDVVLKVKISIKK